ncbi:elongation factor P maturation arginine rhamnosyltransferase EarP [Achromobacter sp. ES-001]|uniref:elongation factor P maturation arginine rhamnosyltransferase EarP n=1 Tax=Achromobacter sp. ES-001 TaxID=2860286 RepID=UPI001C63D17F|nr:elongation factor P maturation arginine rhamnosyltransferase EarP [Achromobacter sp. ES-001]QYJ19726.1 elongation factor P maturation arginine rhamnosyltransferase EarP [Achromobacter sp. ES-001]
MQADIFCRVVDNYGDIGVCWRLARRLAAGRGWDVRLWVDDLASFARIQPGIAPDAPRQALAGVDIVHWSDTPDPTLTARDVVIEAFACDPPEAFLQSMQRVHPAWINLEYLSAEAWVESCHGLPSQRPDGLVKHFFFPGFTAATGGLLREPGLSAERDALQASMDQQNGFLRSLGVSDAVLAHRQDGARTVSLFCYPTAPAGDLVRALAADSRPCVLLAPEGVAPGLEAACQAPGAPLLARLPFVAQPDFDRVLWLSGMNFVRGEDSFIRAAWAARPLVWQIYPQDQNVHLEKLEAWLARYPAPDTAQALIRAWNQPETGQTRAAMTTALAPDAWAAWQDAARTWDASQAAQPDLAENLADFCADLAKKR